MNHHEPTLLSVTEFADRVNRSKRQIYKHIKTGRIKGSKPRPNASYQISESEVNKFLDEFGFVNGHEPVRVHSRIDTNVHTDDTVNRHEHSQRGADVHDTEGQSGSLDRFTTVHLALVERVARSERRQVELEFELRQHQLLLTENAESLHQERAGVKEAEAKKESLRAKYEVALEERQEERDRARAEAAQAKAEAELLKGQIAEIEAEKERLTAEASRPWYKKLFGKLT